MRSSRFRSLTVSVIAICTACMSGDVRLLEQDWRSDERLRRMDLVVEEQDGDNWVVDPTRVDAGDIQAQVMDHCWAVLAGADHGLSSRLC